MKVFVFYFDAKTVQQSLYGIHEAGVCILHIFLKFRFFYFNCSLARLKFMKCNVFRFCRGLSSGTYESFPLNRICRIFRFRRHFWVFSPFRHLQWIFFRWVLNDLWPICLIPRFQKNSKWTFATSSLPLSWRLRGTQVFSFGLLSDLNRKPARFEIDFLYSTNQKVAQLFLLCWTFQFMWNWRRWKKE